MAKKILLADDSVTIQKVVELTFSDEYEITAVGDGAKALESLQQNKPDLILCDVIMPEKNGYEVCEFVKNTPGYEHIPVILLTGTFESFDPERAKAVGSDDVVMKPFDSQSLTTKVRELLSKIPEVQVSDVEPEQQSAVEEPGSDSFSVDIPGESAVVADDVPVSSVPDAFSATPEVSSGGFESSSESFPLSEEPVQNAPVATEEPSTGGESDVFAVHEPVSETAPAVEEPVAEQTFSDDFSAGGTEESSVTGDVEAPAEGEVAESETFVSSEPEAVSTESVVEDNTFGQSEAVFSQEAEPVQESGGFDSFQPVSEEPVPEVTEDRVGAESFASVPEQEQPTEEPVANEYDMGDLSNVESAPEVNATPEFSSEFTEPVVESTEPVAEESQDVFSPEKTDESPFESFGETAEAAAGEFQTSSEESWTEPETGVAEADVSVDAEADDSFGSPETAVEEDSPATASWETPAEETATVEDVVAEEPVVSPVEESVDSEESVFSPEPSEAVVEAQSSVETFDEVVETSSQSFESENVVEESVPVDEAPVPETSDLMSEEENVSADGDETPAVEPERESAPSGGLSESDIEKIAEKVVEKSTEVIKDIVWEVVPDLAEVLIKKKLDQIEKEAEDNS